MKQSTSFLEELDDETATADVPAAARVVVPSLVGAEPHVAVERLREVGLVPVVEALEVTDEDLVGVVCVQEPDTGSELESGGVVVVAVGERSVRLAAEEPMEACDPDLVDEDDDWFDIELPGENSGGPPSGVSEAEHGVPQAPDRARARRVAGFPGRGWRARRIVVLGAITLAVLAVATLPRSNAPRHVAVSARHATSTQPASSRASARAPADGPQRRVGLTSPLGGSRPAVRRSARRPLHAPVPVPARPVPSSAPLHRAASVHPTPCEFCVGLAER